MGDHGGARQKRPTFSRTGARDDITTNTTCPCPCVAAETLVTYRDAVADGSTSGTRHIAAEDEEYENWMGRSGAVGIEVPGLMPYDIYEYAERRK
eukprot:7383248-Prymnesium_polylepis.1